MKKLAAFVLALFCVSSLVGCKPDGSTDLMELNEVKAFVSEKGYTEENLKEKLSGRFNEDIIHSWGEPDGHLSGFWGDVWNLNDEDDKFIILYYDENGYVEDIAVGSHVND